MIDTQLLSLDLRAQLDLVQIKKISPAELAQQQLALVERVNPALNAFLCYEPSVFNEQRNVAPLRNISIAVKDNIDVLGFASTAGMLTRQGRMPTEDAFVIQKLRNAGGVISGKLNMDEGGLGKTNHNINFGNCHNPHRIGFTPGGASGGSASAVSACMTALAIGTDTMGSVRIPASYCGVFGLKPSPGMVSNRGSLRCSPEMDSIGPLARSARDVELALGAMCGFDLLDSQSINYQTKGYLQLPDLPVLLVPEDLSLLISDDSIIADFKHNIQVFIDIGCQVKMVDLSHYDFAAGRRAELLLCEAQMRAEHQYDWQQSPEKFSAPLRALLGGVDNKSPVEYILAEQVFRNAVISARKLFTTGSYLLMPTTGQRAFSFDAEVPQGQADLCCFADQAGLTALSLPMISESELPAGMQLIGQAGSDFAILKLAQAWQYASGYHFQMPGVIQALCE
jgi:Asp-tRNA(Asn)/Glu-tRNA(Gln) amidotransferase A subunit family amidase